MNWLMPDAKPTPVVVTDWESVAMTLTRVMIEERPDYAPYVDQLIAENSKVETRSPA